MLEFHEVFKRYGAVQALDDVSFKVEPGALVGFLGPNGAGKTTAMRSVFGLVLPDAGRVTWGDHDISPAMRLRFGYMPEQRGLYPRMRLASQLSYFGQLHEMTRHAADSAAHAWLEKLGLADRAKDRLEDLSHGNQQRIQLATALIHEPNLLVLDEPFSGLDPIGVAAMTDILRERLAAGAAVIFSSHQLDLVEDLCESVVVINQGAIVLDGAVRTLRASSPFRYLETDVDTSEPWWQKIDGVDLVDSGPPLRLRIAREVNPNDLLSAALAAGTIDQFSFTPPTLSQVFREAVGQ